MKNWKRYSLILVLLFAAVLSSCRSSVQTMGEPAEGAGREGNGGKASKTSDNIVICLDAGHGFDDIGTSSEFLADTTEKEITLAIVLKLRDCLVDNGFDVILTHNGELFPKTRIDDGNNVFNPQERIAYADTLDIDCFVSIHCDSFVSDSSVHGTRVYYSKGTTHQKESASAAKEISAAIDAAFPDAKKCLTLAIINADFYI